MSDSNSQTIWVIGGGTGIGREIAIAYAEAGYKLVVSGRREAKLNDLKESHNMTPLVFDVASDSGLEQVKDFWRDKKLSKVFFCAGICEYEDDLGFNIERYQSLMNTNFLGAVRSVKIALPLLLESTSADEKSQVVLVGSLSSTFPFPRAEIYGSSKAALDYFARSLRFDLSHSNIDVSFVRPGFVQTDLVKNNDFDMPFIVSAQEAARIIFEGVQKRRSVIDFPKRLSWPLRLMSVFYDMSYRLCAKKMSRLKVGDDYLQKGSL